MYGLINRSIQCFVEDMHSAPLWDAIVSDAQLETREFEAMLEYPDETTDAILAAAAKHLRSDVPSVLEDIGTYLVTHPNREAVRRLLRFGGHNFDEFLQSLDDLHDRVFLAVPDLELPDMELREFTMFNFTLTCRWRRAGFGSVFLGILRAMADDYGALVFLDYQVSRTEEGVIETVKIDVLERDFAEGRDFALAQQAAG